MSFFSENQQALKDFVRMSQAVGARADYVQGGGGNTSVKFLDGKMAIKASGFKPVSYTHLYFFARGTWKRGILKESWECAGGMLCMLMNIIVLAQLAATLVVGVYFFRQMRAQSAPERAAHAGGKAQAEWKRLNALRRIHLSEPLSEQARPTRLEDIVGQGDAVEALMAVLLSLIHI